MSVRDVHIGQIVVVSLELETLIVEKRSVAEVAVGVVVLADDCLVDRHFSNPVLFLFVVENGG